MTLTKFFNEWLLPSLRLMFALPCFDYLRLRAGRAKPERLSRCLKRGAGAVCTLGLLSGESNRLPLFFRLNTELVS